MNIEPDPFERLTKLLVLKKYEKPPPRYVQDFSDRVIARIEADQQARAQSWLKWLGLDFGFTLKPALASAMGLVGSAALLIGILSLGKVPTVAEPMASDNMFAQKDTTVAVFHPEDVPSSTAPVASALPSVSPFSQVALHAQPASWVVR